MNEKIKTDSNGAKSDRVNNFLGKVSVCRSKITKKISKGEFVLIDSEGFNVGKVISVYGEVVSVELFHSIAKREILETSINQVREITIPLQTRCYVWLEDKQKWRVGRIGNFDCNEYEVSFPDKESKYINQSQIFIRCMTPIEDPTEVLIYKGHETAYFYERRRKFVEELTKQRNLSRGMSGLLSSMIQLYPHQVEVICRVLADPIQRYLLADEVGLGKTIEAGVILRQFLLDYHKGKILIVTPPFLKEQWKAELEQKFGLFDLAEDVQLIGTDEISQVSEDLQFDFVVIDEAHHIAGSAFSENGTEQEQYYDFCKLAKATKRLLLLSGTPVLNHEKDFLAMLHLLDPDNYPLDNLENFKVLLVKRQEIGRFLLSFNEGSNPFVIKMNLKRIPELFQNDEYLLTLTAKLQAFLSDGQNVQPNDIDYLIHEIRLHITETYRLHRRMLRSRRENLESGILIDRGKNIELIREYDLDERTFELDLYLEDWRLAANSFIDSLDSQTAEALKKDFLKVFTILAQTSGTCPDFFGRVLKCRLQPEFSNETINNIDISVLKKAPLFDGEMEILTMMLNMIEIPSEEGDRSELLIEILKKYRRNNVANQPLPKIVVFTSYTEVCISLSKKISKAFSGNMVANLYCGLSQKIVEQNCQRFLMDRECFVFVCDYKGEEGRNLQFADVVIHFDFPWSPYRMEQRIGRLDRIGRDNPLRMNLFMGPDSENSIQEAWLNVLEKGFDLFNKSIASLQFYIDSKLPEIYLAAFENGAKALNELIPQIIEEIKDERVKISEQQALDEIDSINHYKHDFLESLIEHDVNSEKIKKQMESWICETLGFEKKGLNGGVSYIPTKRTLVPLNILLGIKQFFNYPGKYEREIESVGNKCMLYRIGNPLIDKLEEYVRWDDRGRTYAIWRRDNKWSSEEGNEWTGFRCNYLVEANSSTFDSVVAKFPVIDVKVLKRLSDSYFPPRYITIYMDTDTRNVENPAILEILERPFYNQKDGGTDINLSKNRLTILDETIDPDQWPVVCRNIRDTSEGMIEESSELKNAVEKAVAFVNQTYQKRVNQIMLKKKRENINTLVSDLMSDNDVELEQLIGKTIKDSISKPRITLDSIGFFVISGRDPLERGTDDDR